MLSFTALPLALVLAAPPLGGVEGFNAHVERLVATGDAHGALRLAQGFAVRGEVDRAVRWAGIARERGAHPVRVHLVRGTAYLATERYEFALREFFEALVAAPENGHAQVQLWRCLREVDVLPDIVDRERLRRQLVDAGFYLPNTPARPIDPIVATRLRKRAFAALHAGHPRAALETFRAAIAKNDTHPESYRGLGRAYEALGQQRKAVGGMRLFLALEGRETRATRHVRRFVYAEERRRGLTLP